MNLWYFLLFTVINGFILFEKGDNTLPLYENNQSLSLVIDTEDWPGVIRAAGDLIKDFRSVTGNKNSIKWTNDSNGDYCSNTPKIIVGTIGNSTYIDDLIDQGIIDVSEIEDKWESFIITPLNCSTVVIAGSDKRGTIFGIYSISEQIGVSPWYYWADIPIPSHSSIYFNRSAAVVAGEPSVKYRGFFINDEAPALTRWVYDNYPEANYTSHFVHEFYNVIFEILLRSKANFLWPAVWHSMFGLDDLENQKNADYYGVVMSTSHTEPLQRAQNEWIYEGDGDWDYVTNKDNIIDYWRIGIERGKDYEGVWTEGMRGLGDTAMSAEDETAVLEEVIKTQRQLLLDAFGNDTNISTIPQVWCLYKEVQIYYQQGMTVPDDITLLWVDDNWGNIRRLPTANETSRPGGAGVYYHFDYVGDPRDYKWINTISLTRTWEQMNMAYRRKADTIWVVNVGDLKGLEIPTAQFLDLGYDFEKYGQANQVGDWINDWTFKQFGQFVNDSTVDEIASIINDFSFLTGKRKFEYINETIFSLLNYNEATLVLNQWSDLSNRAWVVYNNSLPEAAKPAFFQLVLHPCNAGYIVHDMYISAGKNALYASQSRNQAQALADHVRQRFQDDIDWRKYWDSQLDGKWEHMMDQPHLGYVYWQNPMRDSSPFVSDLNLDVGSISTSAGYAVEGSQGAAPGDNQYNAVSYSNNSLFLPQLDPYSGNTWIEVFAQGPDDFDFELSVSNDSIILSQTNGTISAQNNSVWNSIFVNVSVDWDKVESGVSMASINFTTNATNLWYDFPNLIFLPLNKTQLPSNFSGGFVESQGCVSIEAEHYTKNSSSNDTYYVTLDYFGRTKSGVSLFPATLEAQNATEDSSYLEYDFYAFTGSNVTNISLVLSPSMNIDPANPLRYGIAIDDNEPDVYQVYEDPTNPTSYPEGWELAVEQNAWFRETTHDISPGKHSLKVWLLDANMVIQKIIIDFGGVKESYFGPPESYIKQ